MKSIVLFTTALLLGSAGIHAQQEFLTTVNPATGQFVCIDSLPGVKWISDQPTASTFDEVNNKYFFRGMPSPLQYTLYAVNAITGKLKSVGPCPIQSATLYNIGQFEFDNSNGNIYGLATRIGDAKLIFLKVDTASAVVSTISIVPGTHFHFNQHTYDQANHRYIFTGATNGNNQLNTIDALTGNVIYNAPFVSNKLPMFPRYNSLTSKLYAVANDTGIVDRLVTLDLQTGLAITTLTTITGINWNCLLTPNRATLDEFHNRFTLLDNVLPGKLYTIDLTNGNHIYTPAFTMGTSTATNIIEFRYDNSNGHLHALHWGTFIKDNTGIVKQMAGHFQLTVFPNPTSAHHELQIETDITYESVQFINLMGQVVFETLSINRSALVLPEMSPGVYQMILKNKNHVVGLTKLVIEN